MKPLDRLAATCRTMPEIGVLGIAVARSRSSQSFIPFGRGPTSRSRIAARAGEFLVLLR